MNKKIIFSLLLLVLIPIIDNIYAESDLLQKWKDYVESYKDYMEKYKKWVETKFQIYEKSIDKLEKEIVELKQKVRQFEKEKQKIVETEKTTNTPQKIESLESEIMELTQKIKLLEAGDMVQPEVTDTLQPEVSEEAEIIAAEPAQRGEMAYVTTDKTHYGLGDTITVSGFVNRDILDAQFTDQRLDESTTDYNISTISIMLTTSKPHADLIHCARASEYHLEEDANLRADDMLEEHPDFELGVFYINQDGNSSPDSEQRCFDDDGSFEFIFKVDGSYYEAEYFIAFQVYSNHNNPLSGIKSQPFTVS